jgi:xanthine dehydrogenase accessory factor
MTGPEQIWPEAVRTLEAGKRFALATVINVRGSTPREVGAKMIVRDDGQFGTIGGGCGEAEVFRKARMLLDEGATARMAEVDLTGDFEQQEIGTCGGIMDVFISLWTPDRDLALAHRLAESAGNSKPAALLSVVDSGNADTSLLGAKAVITPDSADNGDGLPGLPATALSQLTERAADAIAGLVEIESNGTVRPTTRIEPSGAPRLFLDPITCAQRLIIAGAGHIAQPLATLGTMLGFNVTVIDDRAQFANRERFPTANQIIVQSFRTAIDSLQLDRHCFVVSVTRGHAFDEEVIRAALRQAQRDPGIFIGMIGSRRRVKTTLDRLEEDGVPAELLNRVHAPLGVDIGAETPEEIALSIMGEIVRERRTATHDDFNLGTRLGRLARSAGHGSASQVRRQAVNPSIDHHPDSA